MYTATMPGFSAAHSLYWGPAHYADPLSRALGEITNRTIQPAVPIGDLRNSCESYQSMKGPFSCCNLTYRGHSFTSCCNEYGCQMI
jgi:hypothetical protein